MPVVRRPSSSRCASAAAARLNSWPTRIRSEPSAAQPSTSGLIAPELSRRKEALESFPLDAMEMVGSLQGSGQPVALVRVDKLIYQVRAGNYLGLNYGRVLRVSENELTLREIVQDASGEWIERPATLELQEKSK